jgi:23S rRNA (pseudouridine1915-N3)-methyltransferase
MKLLVIAVGKLKDPGLRALADDYKRRVARHSDFEEREVRDDAALRRALPEGFHIVALEVDGRELTSTEFARTLRGWADNASGKVAFLIGGAEGIPEDVSSRAQSRLSLSRMTMPHRLARVLLFEQLYRASSIWRGEPYARED